MIWLLCEDKKPKLTSHTMVAVVVSFCIPQQLVMFSTLSGAELNWYTVDIKLAFS